MNEAGDAGGGGASESADLGSVDLGSEESSEEGSEELEVEDLTPVQIKKIKQLKLKFNGKEILEDLPFEIDEEHVEWMTKQRQKSMLSDHKANEYKQLENEVGAFIQELRKNPRKALSNPAIGLDIKQFAAEILQEEIENSQKSPEQLEKEALQRELEEIRSERSREKEEAQARELERMTEREYERFDTLMSEAIEASDLPKSPFVVKKMTEYMMLGIEHGINVQPKDIIPIIREEIQQDIKDMFRVMPADVIEQIIGSDALGKLRKKKSAVVKPAVPLRSSIPDVSTKKEVKQEVEKKQSIRDFFGV